MIYLLIALASFGLGMFSVSSMAHLNESVADSLKGTISGAFYLFWGVGFFLGPLLAGKITETVGFGFSFYVLAILIVVETLLLSVSLPSGKALGKA